MKYLKKIENLLISLRLTDDLSYFDLIKSWHIIILSIISFSNKLKLSSSILIIFSFLKLDKTDYIVLDIYFSSSFF